MTATLSLATASRGGRRPRNPLLPLASLLALAAAGVAGWLGSDWYGAAHSPSLAYAQTRDAALRDGEQAIQNMNTLDYRNTKGGLALWEQSTTGDLHAQILNGATAFQQQVQQAGTTTTARVLDGAVTELDAKAGKASLMVALEITVTPRSGKPSAKQSRMLGQLTRTAAGWKLSGLSDAPVGAAGGSSSASSPSTLPSPSVPATPRKK